VARVGGDRAGLAITIAMVEAVRAADHVEVLDSARLRGLLQDEAGRVRGALIERNGALVEITAPAVVLATGGLGGLFPVTTNPPRLRGEGLALAVQAGAVIADPEFVQFHPTAIDVGLDPAPLATEALRGEGAVLVDRDGRRFMAERHPLAELAPRDIVARGVFAEVAAGRGAFLDAVQAVGARFPEEFPTVFEACLKAGVDPRVQPIPVAPAAHYHMGGISADAEGRTNLDGLFAVGECASTGVHGANRLASNSLLEAAAFGAATGATAAEAHDPATRPLACAPAPDLPAPALAELRRAMGARAGVVREAGGLSSLLAQIGELEDRHGAAPPLVAARLLAQAALDRQESRGGHWRADFPETSRVAERTFITLAGPAATKVAAE
jgi:L-aspartate oxidase